MSPFKREKRVIADELVLSNLLYFQKIVWPKKTNPKKKGITPSKNINKFPHDLLKVAVIKFKLLLYWRYFNMVIQANITPKPIKNYLCSKMINFAEINSSKNATSAPKSWKKLPVTVVTNQKSKNFILSKNPNYYQFFFQLTFAFSFDSSIEFLFVKLFL